MTFVPPSCRFKPPAPLIVKVPADVFHVEVAAPVIFKAPADVCHVEAAAPVIFKAPSVVDQVDAAAAVIVNAPADVVSEEPAPPETAKPLFPAAISTSRALRSNFVDDA